MSHFIFLCQEHIIEEEMIKTGTLLLVPHFIKKNKNWKKVPNLKWQGSVAHASKDESGGGKRERRLKYEVQQIGRANGPLEERKRQKVALFPYSWIGLFWKHLPFPSIIPISFFWYQTKPSNKLTHHLSLSHSHSLSLSHNNYAYSQTTPVLPPLFTVLSPLW